MPVMQLTCANCTGDFTRWQRPERLKSRAYCSRACHQKDRTGERNPKWRGDKLNISLICAGCRKVFVRSRERTSSYIWHGKPKTVFCDRACWIRSTRIYNDKTAYRREAGRRYEAYLRAGRKLNGSHSRTEWLSLLAQSGFACVSCGSVTDIVRDHIQPLRRGGGDLISNIQPLCRPCNSAKRNWE